MTPLARYLAALHVVHATGSATGETAYYGPLEALLNAVGARQKPAVQAVFQLRSLGTAPRPPAGPPRGGGPSGSGL